MPVGHRVLDYTASDASSRIRRDELESRIPERVNRKG
jgi:hypothetical protein